MWPFKKKTCCPTPSYTKWSEPEEIYTTNSFNSRTVLFQRRTCENCGHVETKDLQSVSA